MDQQLFCVCTSPLGQLIRHVFYDLPLHNQYKWKTFVNTQKSEARLLRKMHQTYGNDFTVFLGDCSDAGRTAEF
jgi:hypothetical protein